MRLFDTKSMNPLVVMVGILAVVILSVTIWKLAPHYAIANNNNAGLVPISQIQGPSHRSPLDGKEVRTQGVVTAISLSAEKNPVGFYLQDPVGDDDPATSEALLIFTRANPNVNVGDLVQVEGRVKEYGFRGGLTVTEIIESKTRKIAQNQPLPKPVVIGMNGRKPPTEVIDDDGLKSFDPDDDGIDFYESLENMLVRVEEPVITGSTDKGELIVIADGGVDATNRTSRGGVFVSEADFNPERIMIDNALSQLTDDEIPAVKVGDRLSGPVEGVLGYSFNNFKIWNSAPLPEIVAGKLEPEVTNLRGDEESVTIASYNVLNLDPNDSDGDRDIANGQFSRIAEQIVNNLKLPDIVALQEIQDNSGSEDKDGIVEADQTSGTLIDEIYTLSQIRYEYVDVEPIANEDGGQPGGNIRVGFLFNPERVQFNKSGQADATLASQIELAADQKPHLTLNPGRIDPQSPAFRPDKSKGWSSCRKSLVAEFDFNGHPIYVLNSHLRSKRGDGALFGDKQPPVLDTVPQRVAQAEVVSAFAQKILSADPNANVVIVGDMNDFSFSAPVRALTGTELTNMAMSIPAEDRYSYVYEGNSQQLDQILVSKNLADKTAFDAVHINAEFSHQEAASDHDPLMIRIELGKN